MRKRFRKIFFLRLLAIFLFTFLSVLSGVFSVDRLLNAKIPLKTMFLVACFVGLIHGLTAVIQELTIYLKEEEEKYKCKRGNPHNDNDDSCGGNIKNFLVF